MDGDNRRLFGGPFRPSVDAALEESGIIGVHRRWTNINRFEIIFLILGLLATIATDGLSIYRMAEVRINEADFAYGTLIIISTLFLLIFLITGIFQQRITDIVAFFISDLLLTIYVVVHYVLRSKDHGDSHTELTVRLVRLICTVSFNILFLPLSIMVIRDYRRDEFSKRLFGAFPAARMPLKFYNIFECVARINTMLSISVCFLNLYNFNSFENYDELFLGIGVPLALLWLGFGVGMIHMESRVLMAIFYLISLFQPGFIIYCLISAIKYPATTTTTTTITSTHLPTFTTIASTTSRFVNLDMINLMNTPAPFSFYAMLEAAREIPVIAVLYVCIGLNLFTHILTIILTVICIGNFGKGLRERVFNSRLDKYFSRLLFRQ